MTFSKALNEMKKGKRAFRTGWNGMGKYICICTVDSVKNLSGEEIVPYHKDNGNTCIVFRGTRGNQIGWLASQTDMLAEDWDVF